VPANKIGFAGNGGPFDLFQLKVLQEIISLLVFTLVAILVFKTEQIKWNHILAFVFIVLAVYFAFKK